MQELIKKVYEIEDGILERKLLEKDYQAKLSYYQAKLKNNAITKNDFFAYMTEKNKYEEKLVSVQIELAQLKNILSDILIEC